MEEPKSLLSVLSHVVHGYVGNRSVVFPLQFAGWDVDAINTTNFLNHPGYGKFQGLKTEPELLDRLFAGLADILDLNEEYKMVLVGYCPSAAIMETVYKQLKKVLRGEKRPVLVVDPVLGDNGRLYVPADVVPVHKEFLKLGYVDLTTPNQFELELLTDVKIDDWSTVKEALAVFWERYKVPNVVLLSIVIDDNMYCVGYSEGSIFHMPISKIDCSFNGCGDVFTGLLTNAFYENGYKLSPAVLGGVLAKLHKILMHSYEQEKLKTGTVPTLVKDVRIISLRHVLLEDSGDKWNAVYL